MKNYSLTIRLDKRLQKALEKAGKASGMTRSEIAREALEQQLRLLQYESLRKRVMPFAESRGYLTDEDVFKEVS